MNRPILPPTDQQKTETQFRKQRLGLSSAEAIVTLLLRRYGIDEEPSQPESPSPLAVELVAEPAVPVVAQPVTLQQQSFCWK